MDYGTYSAVKWAVELGDEFQPEYEKLHTDVQDELLAMTLLLQQFGPQLGRPHVDTLFGESHLPSTPGAKLCCLSLEINQAAARRNFIAN